MLTIHYNIYLWTVTAEAFELSLILSSFLGYKCLMVQGWSAQ